MGSRITHILNLKTYEYTGYVTILIISVAIIFYSYNLLNEKYNSISKKTKNEIKHMNNSTSTKPSLTQHKKALIYVDTWHESTSQ